jgi:hypothetical protein
MSVTFTRTVAGSYDPETDTDASPVTTTITGEAVRVRGRPETYRALSLIESEAPTLFFTPSEYGDRPKPGDTVVWETLTWTVRDVNPIAPDGVLIAARIVITR